MPLLVIITNIIFTIPNQVIPNASFYFFYVFLPLLYTTFPHKLQYLIPLLYPSMYQMYSKHVVNSIFCRSSGSCKCGGKFPAQNMLMRHACSMASEIQTSESLAWINARNANNSALESMKCLVEFRDNFFCVFTILLWNCEIHIFPTFFGITCGKFTDM